LRNRGRFRSRYYDGGSDDDGGVVGIRGNGVVGGNMRLLASSLPGVRTGAIVSDGAGDGAGGSSSRRASAPDAAPSDLSQNTGQSLAAGSDADDEGEPPVDLYCEAVRN